MTSSLSAAAVLAVLSLAPAFVAAQKPAKPDKTPPAIVDFEHWISEYVQAHVLLSGAKGASDVEVRRMEQVFDALAAMGDLAAAKRLFKAAVISLPAGTGAATLRQAQPWTVQRTARAAIAKMTDPGIEPWLATVLTERSKPGQVSPRLAAIDILATRGGPNAAAMIEKTIATSDREDRIEAALALGRVGSLSSLAVLQKLCTEGDPAVRTAGISAIGAIFREREAADGADPVRAAAVQSLRELACSDKVWQVRAAARDTLVRLRAPEAIPVLIDALKAEQGRKDSQRHLVAALHGSLVQMTGQDVPEGRADIWEEFWRKEGPTFRYSKEKKETETETEKEKEAKSRPKPANYAKYFNLEIKSDRILFVVDASGSMNEKVQLKTGYAGGAGGGEHVKYDLVKRELERAIRSLPDDASCNVVFFASEVTSFEQDKEGNPKLMKMTDRNKGDLIQFIWQTQPTGSTNLYGGLDTALRLAGRGARDKYYQVGFDTIFVLSDGAPSVGEVTDTNEILKRVREANELKRVVIHAVTFGDEKNNVNFLRELAHQSGGEHLHVE